MPYTKQADRVKETIDTAGDLNFRLTRVCVEYLRESGLSYNEAVNPIMAELEDLIDDPFGVLPVTSISALGIDLRKQLKLFPGSKKDAKGAIRACQLEFYARVARPYEEEAKNKNGDVYDVYVF